MVECKEVTKEKIGGKTVSVERVYSKVYKARIIAHAKFGLSEKEDIKPIKNEDIHFAKAKTAHRKQMIKQDDELYELESKIKRYTEFEKAFTDFLIDETGKLSFPTFKEEEKKVIYQRRGFAMKVSNISEDFGDEDLRKLFGKYGDILRVVFPTPKFAEKDKVKKVHYGFALVLFRDASSIDRVLLEKEEFVLGNIILTTSKK